MTLMVDGDGQVHRQQASSAAQLPGTFWKLNRSTGSEDGHAEVLRTLESAPFYARSMISTTLQGCRQKAIHENLDLHRLVKTSTQLMLPFRMPRNP
jgi:carotenoid 1,2-hydratase